MNKRWQRQAASPVTKAAVIERRAELSSFPAPGDVEVVVVASAPLDVVADVSVDVTVAWRMYRNHPWGG